MALRVVSGADAGARLAADSERLTIGTHERCDVVLRDRAVSRFHCEIVVEGGRFVVRDTGSRNGTWVDGVSILAAHLRDGSTLRVGTTEMRFEIGATPLQMPVSGDARFGALVGGSVAMRAAFARLARAAATDATVLLAG
jgi:pSer/pThr/pTyr-binding forkhead associated (FHA) protein